MMLSFYRVFSSVVYRLAYLIGKGRADKGNQLWKGRLGLISADRPSRIWLHAASVGEVRICSHLIDFLLRKDPGLTIHLTTMTRTGFNTARQSYQSPGITLSYFPIDSKTGIERTLDVIGPSMIVITETEIWPNLVSVATQRQIPIVLINARMTEKALGRYRWMRPAMGPLLNRYDRFFFKTDSDAARYHRLGLNPELGQVVGDMKFDAPLGERSAQKSAEVRQKLGANESAFLFVAGSTRPGEEAVMANVFRELSHELKNLVIVIAPRHVERVDEIKSLLDDKGEQYGIYGDNPDGRRLVLVDRMGLLNDLYLAADLAFVGGTLVDIGGHNILEPVWAGCPVVFGPSLFNVEESADYITRNDFGATVRSEEELVSLLKKVHSGDIMYARKQGMDPEISPTATIGNYILKRLGDA